MKLIVKGIVAHYTGTFLRTRRMGMTSAQKANRFRQKKRAEGNRLLHVWVPVEVFQDCIDKVTAIVEEHSAKAKDSGLA